MNAVKANKSIRTNSSKDIKLDSYNEVSNGHYHALTRAIFDKQKAVESNAKIARTKWQVKTFYY